MYVEVVEGREDDEEEKKDNEQKEEDRAKRTHYHKARSESVHHRRLSRTLESPRQEYTSSRRGGSESLRSLQDCPPGSTGQTLRQVDNSTYLSVQRVVTCYRTYNSSRITSSRSVTVFQYSNSSPELVLLPTPQAS